MNYYNEFDPYAAQWLRNLIAAGLIPQGEVDERPIQEVKPYELGSYTQCHFFAGIGGWPLALQLAGWPSDRPVWTGSCPCQPFSVCGKGKGEDDERHLWPVWGELIKERKPPTIFGEQVAGQAGLLWFAGVRTDLEGIGYAVGGGVIYASSLGALHARPRTFFVADSEGIRSEHTSHARGDVFLERDRAKEKIQATRSFACDKGRFFQKVRSSEFVRTSNGIPGRLVAIRGFGNAIVPQVAAEFIKAYMTITRPIPTTEEK